MAAHVYFCLSAVPRTTTREEWYIGWRKVREMRHRQMEFAYQEREAIANKGIDKRIRQQLIDQMINPPILLGPWM